METMTADHDTHPAAQLTAWVIIVVLNILSDLTLETTYLWIFRGLSLLSLILIIAINFKKGVAEIKSLFKK